MSMRLFEKEYDDFFEVRFSQLKKIFESRRINVYLPIIKLMFIFSG